MSQFKVSQLDQAQAAFSKCNKISGQHLPKPDQELSRDWRDCIIAHSLRDEAEKLIKDGKND